MKCSVLIPTWKRPDKLKLCLDSLLVQTRPADQVVITYRMEDTPGIAVINSFINKLPITHVRVVEPGVIHAENQAMIAATGEIICFIDDDAEAPDNWLEKILAHFVKDPNLSGIGGPDFITGDHPSYRKMVSRVGYITWYGKCVGNHHHQVKQIIKVDALKGVNMAFHRSWLRPLDVNLSSEHSKGNGSFWELDLCLDIVGRNGKLLFDPALEVKHHSNHQHFIVLDNLKNSSHNMVYVLMKHLKGFRRWFFLFYIFMIGNRQLRGWLWTFIFLFINGPKIFKESFYSQWGMVRGLMTYMKMRPAKSRSHLLGT